MTGPAGPPPAPPASGGGDLATAIREAAARFAAFSATPRLDAELLAAHALGTTRDAMLLRGVERIAMPEGYAALVARRAGQEPMAYILGTRDFWTIELTVGPGVLVPRADSETLIEAAVDHFHGTAGPARVLDLGTGSGALLLSALAEWPEAQGTGVDASAEALVWARRNAAALGFATRARLIEGGWDAAEGVFDLVLANPPYIGIDEPLPDEVRAFEPAGALFAGADGLDDYRAIAPLVADRLAPGGVGCVEIGHAQAEAAGALFRVAGLDVAVRRDLGGRDRCLVVSSG